MCLLASTLVLAVNPVKAQDPHSMGSSLFFSDDFNGTTIDSGKWEILENVNGGFGGNVTVAANSISLSSNGTSFPIITSAVNPFPESGDFNVEFDIQYTHLDYLGSGLWISQGPFVPAWPNGALSSNILEVWSDSGESSANSCLCVTFLGVAVYNKTILTTPNDFLNSSVFKVGLGYVTGNYTLTLNGEKIVSMQSELRADTIGFGHPPISYIPFPTPSDWTSFKIDSINVYQETPSSSSSPPQTPDPNIFNVESNSTVTALTFNSENSELSFNVTGPSGTTGYTNVTIAKSLLSNVDNLKVYIDGNQTNYQVSSNEVSWLLSFTYSHSTHKIIISLSEAETSSLGVTLGGWIVAIILVVAMLAALAALVKRKKATTNNT
jgi:hypothetical protein